MGVKKLFIMREIMNQEYKVNSKKLNFRSTPVILSNNIISTLSQGAIVMKLEVSNDPFWWKITTIIGSQGQEGFVANKFLSLVIDPSIPTEFTLSGSVGNGGINNDTDVQRVKTRLADLGFAINRDSVADSDTIDRIKLFQSSIKGAVVINGDGRVDIDGPTHKFLQAANAPQWTEMPKGSATEGFINHDAVQGDNHDYGTNWMVETIQEAAQKYITDYRATHPNAAVIQTNNLSLPMGGDTPHHGTHETGLSCDIRVPRLDGRAGTTINSNQYDRNSMRAMLKAIRGQRKYEIKEIFFNDFILITEGLCIEVLGHHNHAHINITPPSRQ